MIDVLLWIVTIALLVAGLAVAIIGVVAAVELLFLSRKKRNSP